MPEKTELVLYSLIGLFVLILAFFLLPLADIFKQKYFIALAVLGLIFLVLGIILIVLSLKEEGTLRVFLMMTGIAAIAPLVFTILHNLFYGLAITFENLKMLFETLHVASFIISLIVAPLLFVVGVIGSIVLLRGE